MLIIVIDIAFPNEYKKRRRQKKQYSLVMDNYLEAEAATGRIARQIAA